MKTAFQTGPGLYAANTNKVDRTIPKDVLRVYLIRMEAYDLTAGDDSMNNVQFQILFAMAENNPQIAQALLTLRDSINGNEATLRDVVNRKGAQ